MKIFFCVAFVIFLGVQAFAQANGDNFNLPNIASPAPQAAALARYGDIPVSISTGVPNISIPFFTISSGKLSVPISINYHASGIKVMDQASPAGLGWALNTGGDITRVVQGLPDEWNGHGFPNLIMPDPNDPSSDAKELCLANNMTNNTANSANQYDGQPDLFFFSVGNKSGSFVSKNCISQYQQPGFMTMPYYPINITETNAYATFVITDDDGTQYFYNRFDSTTQDIEVGSVTTITPTAWHLVKILSVERADSIVFQYGTVSTFNYTTSPSPTLVLNYNDLIADNFTYGPATVNTIGIREYLVSEIDFSNGKVTFDYRSGLGAGQTDILNAIHLYNDQNGTFNEIKRFTLFHSAFSGTNVSRLDSVQESGYYNGTVIQNPSYAFNYFSYEGYQCPPFNSYAQDFWGYFNGKLSNTDMNFIAPGNNPNESLAQSAIPISAAYKRKPDSNYLKVATLQSIRYPTGGTTTFDFAPNQIKWPVLVSDTTNYYTTLQNTYMSNFNATVNSTAAFPAIRLRVNSNFGPVYYDGAYVNGTAGTPNPNAMLCFSILFMCSPSSDCVQNPMNVQVLDMTRGDSVCATINVFNPPPFEWHLRYCSFQYCTRAYV